MLGIGDLRARVRLLVGGLVTTALLSLAATAAPAGAQTPNVETRYGVNGPATVAPPLTVPAGFGKPYNNVIVYPGNMATDGRLNPIVTWGNGGGQSCASAASEVLHRLASWGFVAVCADWWLTFSGIEAWDAAQYMIAENSRPASRFYQKLDTSNVGAVGASWGAEAVARATILSNGVITSTVSIETLENAPVSWGEIDTPLFLVSGAASDATPAGMQAIYAQLGGPKARAMRVGATHTDTDNLALPYITAWLAYTLMDDPVARTGFAGSSPQILTSPNYTNEALSGLP